MASSAPDELAVYELLLEDLRAASLTDDAEKMQLQEILAATNPGTECIDGNKDSDDYHPSDLTVAFGLNEKEVEIARDQAYAQMLQDEHASQDATVTLSRQYAQRLAAAETKIRMDSEFAAKLQVMIDDDHNANHDAYDADKYFTLFLFLTRTGAHRNIIRVLGKDIIEDILVSILLFHHGRALSYLIGFKSERQR